MPSRPAEADPGELPERLVLDELPVVVWATDADLRFTMSFGGGLAALGLEPGQVVGLGLTEYFGTDDLAFPAIAAHRRALSGVEGRYETSWQGRTFESRVWPMRGEGGRIAGVAGFALDVTRTRATEERLRESEERYRTLVERLPGAVYVAEPGADGVFFFISPQIEPITGFPAQAWLDDPTLWERQLHPDDRERVLAGEERASSRGEGLTAEYRFIHADGSVIWLEDEARSIFGEDGKPLFWGILYDVTGRMRAEAALRTAELKFQKLVEAGPGIVYVHDEGRFPPALTYISPQVTDLLGYPPQAWERDPTFWVGRIHPEDRKRVLHEAGSAIRRGEPLVHEYRLVASDGREVWVQDRATSVRDEDEAPLFRQGLLVDVSKRRRAEEDRRRALESQLALANRLEAIHELDRTLLSAASADEMVVAALERVRFLVPCDRASVRFYRPEPPALVMGHAWERDGVELDIPADIVLDDESLRIMGRELSLVPDLREVTDPPSALRPLAAAGVRSGIGAPLASEGEYLGYLAVLSVSPGRFDDRHAEVVREIADALAIGLRETRLRDALRDRADQLARLAEERRQLLHRIVRAQEEERGRVALEIHDGIGQVLTSISLFAADLEKDVREGLRPRAARLSELVRRAISDSRALVWSLRPPELERLGLVPALRRLAEDATAGGEVAVDLHEEIGGLRLGEETEAVVYRVVQEALNNAQKHAQASCVSIVLGRGAGSVAVVVEDDGRGFDPVTLDLGGGTGLIGMRERAELVSGALVVESREGGGTRVRLEVPVASDGGSNGGA